MSVIDILFRVDEICKKYEKYDVEKQRATNTNSDDRFANLYGEFESQIDAAIQKSESAANQKNRATAVAMNAEVRRLKSRLMDEIPKLQKLAQKKVKGLSKEDLEARTDMVLALPERIKAIPDGTSNQTQGSGSGASSSHKNNIKFDHERKLDSDFFEETEESSQFRQEHEKRKMKQDEGLDEISEGLDTLKNLAKDMNEELDRQVPLMDEMDTKMDKASVDLKRNNVRLKETLYKVRSSRNFCLDIILMCIILGIASYLYNVLR